MADIRLSYYPDITQHRTPATIRSAIKKFAAALQAELRRDTAKAHTVTVLPVVSVREQTALAAKQGCEIALMKPASYLFAHGRNSNVRVGAVALRRIDGKIGDTYFAQIYAHAKLKVRTFAQLQAACRKPLAKRPSVAFGDSFSTSNFLVNAALLKDVGIHPLTRFRRAEFFGGHELAAKAVYRGLAEVGAGHDGAIIDLAKQRGYRDAEKKLIRIGRRDIHSDPVAIIVDDALLRTQIEQALLAIESQPVVKKALDVFWGAVLGLGPTRHENYRSIEDSIKGLGIPEGDILGE